MDRVHEGRTQRQVKDLRDGDHVDLQNDRYADPEGFRTGEISERCHSNGWEFEFAVVVAVYYETPHTVVVDFEDGSFAFPPDHWIDVDGEQVREGV